MTIAEPLVSVDEKALESEIGRTVPKLARTSAAFRQTESGDGEPAAEIINERVADRVVRAVRIRRECRQTDVADQRQRGFV